MREKRRDYINVVIDDDWDAACHEGNFQSLTPTKTGRAQTESWLSHFQKALIWLYIPSALRIFYIVNRKACSIWKLKQNLKNRKKQVPEKIWSINLSILSIVHKAINLVLCVTAFYTARHNAVASPNKNTVLQEGASAFCWKITRVCNKKASVRCSDHWWDRVTSIEYRRYGVPVHAQTLLNEQLLHQYLKYSFIRQSWKQKRQWQEQNSLRKSWRMRHSIAVQMWYHMQYNTAILWNTLGEVPVVFWIMTTHLGGLWTRLQ